MGQVAVVAGVEWSITPSEVKKDLSSSPTIAASTLSTPERKRIYATFTFSSPSPASKRLADVRGSSVERFSDVVL